MSVETTPTTEAEFGDALRTLVQHAHENGIDVEGGWDCRFDDHADYEVVIVETTDAD